MFCAGPAVSGVIIQRVQWLMEVTSNGDIENQTTGQRRRRGGTQ